MVELFHLEDLELLLVCAKTAVCEGNPSVGEGNIIKYRSNRSDFR